MCILIVCCATLAIFFLSLGCIRMWGCRLNWCQSMEMKWMTSFNITRINLRQRVRLTFLHIEVGGNICETLFCRVVDTLPAVWIIEMTYRKQVWLWPVASVLFYPLWWQLEWIICLLNHHACFTCWSSFLSSYLLWRLRIGIRPFAGITHHGGHSSSRFETLVSWSCQAHLKSTVFDSAFVCFDITHKIRLSFKLLTFDCSALVTIEYLFNYDSTFGELVHILVHTLLKLMHCTVREVLFLCSLYVFSLEKAWTANCIR